MIGHNDSSTISMFSLFENKNEKIILDESNQFKFEAPEAKSLIPTLLFD